MNQEFKTVNASKVTISQLMLPSHSNFNGKIHGGYILSLMDQIAFACASKYSGVYCVTASVDTVDFLSPILIVVLVTMKASVIFFGLTSMVIGFMVEAENIQTGKTKHCNSSYFTMVAKDREGNSVPVPGLVISSLEEVRRFYNSLKRIALKKERDHHEENFDYSSKEVLKELEKYNIRMDIQ